MKANINSSIHEISLVKKEENLDAVEPAINDRKENFPFYILNKSSIIFHTNFKGKEPYIIYDEILCGDYNIKIDYTKLLKSKYYCEQSHQKNELSEYFLKLLNFLKEIEKRINNKFLLNYNLKIKLDIRKEEYNNNSNSTYNISCFYTFYDPIRISTYKYKDENILINATNSKNQGFQFMLYQKNNECYKDLKYQEFDINNKSDSKRQNEEKKMNKNNFENKRKKKI